MSRRRRAVNRVAVLAAALALGAASACQEERNPRLRVGEGNPELGAQAIERYGCGSCHTIPGIDGADALVGPPLNSWRQRTYIAGQLPNTPENLVRWIRNPQEVEPGTAMPDLGVSEDEARNIAAYLLQLR